MTHMPSWLLFLIWFIRIYLFKRDAPVIVLKCMLIFITFNKHWNVTILGRYLHTHRPYPGLYLKAINVTAVSLLKVRYLPLVVYEFYIIKSLAFRVKRIVSILIRRRKNGFVMFTSFLSLVYNYKDRLNSQCNRSMFM